jgi:predicted dehydrogenase/threonine dehydrogenase-like Zn-dependent dehydrogenase
MRQLFQIPRTGELRMRDVPCPQPAENQIVVRTVASLVSAGTEKHMLEFAQKSLLGKALERPDLARMVFAKATSEGIAEAWRQSMARLESPMPVGYSSAGVVIGLGNAVDSFVVGDRVACSGSGIASHASVVVAPPNLCVKIPEGMDFESAAFAALGGIALEAVRMSEVSLGSRVVVIGLGLLGQIAVQLLCAAGCHVVGMDPDAHKAQMALQNGAEATARSYDELRALVPKGCAHAGFDSAILLAATSSNQPLEVAAEICRERGRVVATGLIGLDLPRKPFYDKELELVVSRAWGPGLYDTSYTSAGLDYPLPYVRWTAQRNLDEFLTQLAKRSVQVRSLISHRFEFSRSLEAYNLILSGKEPYLGVLLTYSQEKAVSPYNSPVWLKKPGRSSSAASSDVIGIGLIGAGLFARGTLLPTLQKIPDVRFRAVASLAGLNASQVAEKFGFDYCTSDYQKLVEDPEIHLIVVATRHGSHAGLACEALRHGKHVLVEKPLAVNREQLEEIIGACGESRPCPSASSPVLMVGFNRRFSCIARWTKDKFAAIREPLAIQCTVNTGPLPADSWVYDRVDGGGRIIGEVCHFIDLIQYLTNSWPRRVYAETLTSQRSHRTDNLVITLKMEDGSVASIQYFSGGDKSYPRERVEIFGGGAVGLVDDFRYACFVRKGRKTRLRTWLSADRGHRAEMETLLDVIRHGAQPPVPLADYVCTTLTTFAIEKALKSRAPVEVERALLLPRPELTEGAAAF